MFENLLEKFKAFLGKLKDRYMARSKLWRVLVTAGLPVWMYFVLANGVSGLYEIVMNFLIGLALYVFGAFFITAVIDGLRGK